MNDYLSKLGEYQGCIGMEMAKRPNSGGAGTAKTYEGSVWTEKSLENKKRYSEFVILSPFTKDGIKFARILFLDGDYVKRNEKYVLGFDALATITYNRGVVTLIGDEMWRVQQIVSKTSAKIGEDGLNILNIDAQEETSRIIIVIEDSADNIKKAINAVHSERSNIKFV